jgi:4-amino-4-deoxy-L-arabinose transferase-like glycosyltransferase
VPPTGALFPKRAPVAVSVAGLTRNPFPALVAVVVVSVGLSAVVAVETPAWEYVDEPSHVMNVESLARGHWYRIEIGRDLGVEAHQPPLYYALLAGVQRLQGQAARPVRPGRPALLPGARGLFVAHRASDHRFLLRLRLPNLLLAAGTVLLTFLAARLLSSDPWTPVVAAALVGFWPHLVFSFAFVNNDNLVNLLGAALTLAALAALGSPTLRRFALIGVVLGLLLLTKLSALPMLVAIPAAAWAVRRRAPALSLAAVATLTVLLISGWYLVDNSVRYGDPLAIDASRDYLQPLGGLGTFLTPYEIDDPLGHVFYDVPSRIFSGFWYTSGWNQFDWPFAVNLLFWLLLGAALAGLRGRGRGAVPLLVVLTLAALSSVWLVSLGTGAYAARLAYVGLPALACLVALALERRPLPVRFALPALLLLGTLVAIQQDVLAVDWY